MKSNLLFLALSLLILLSCGTTKNNVSKISQVNDFHQEIIDFREGKKQEFRENKRAPLVGDEIDNMRFFDPNPQYRVEANITRIENPDAIIIKTSAGEDREYIPYATLQFDLGNESHSLIIHTSQQFIRNPKYRDLLFLMFNDETNGVETYGGGRYLELSKTDIKDGKVILDFNKCYHPYCHYSAGYSCPIPPLDNNLSTKILAGEKKYAGEYKGSH